MSDDLIRRISIQKMPDEMTQEELEGADWQSGYEGVLNGARIASSTITALRALAEGERG